MNDTARTQKWFFRPKMNATKTEWYKFDVEVCGLWSRWLTWKSIFKICIEDKFRVYVAISGYCFQSFALSPHFAFAIDTAATQKNVVSVLHSTSGTSSSTSQLSKCNNKPLFCVFFSSTQLPRFPPCTPWFSSLHSSETAVRLLFAVTLLQKYVYLCCRCECGHLLLPLAY